MSLIIKIASIILFLSVFPSCKKDPTILKFKEIELNTVGKQLVKSDNSFGFELMKIVTENQTENTMVSPLSVSLVLSMTYNGADTETKTAMENTLRLKGLTTDEINTNNKYLSEALISVDSRIEFSIANSIWYRNEFPVLTEFISTNKEYYNAEVSALDFSNPASKNIINNWVANNTNDKITNIVDNISSDIVMYLINAIYFKGIWKYQFDKSKNIKKAFRYTDGSKNDVEMMQQEADLKTLWNEDFYLVELPYGQGNFVIDLFLPNDEKNVSDIISNLNSENWNMWMNAIGEPHKTTIILPPFKFEYEKSLNEILISMGLGIAFDPNNADFSKINTNKQLFISEVKHKTFIELNEEGTEAAAVTSVSVGVTSVGPGGEIIFDKPFLFAIREVSTGVILFLGIVESPVR